MGDDSLYLGTSVRGMLTLRFIW